MNHRSCAALAVVLIACALNPAAARGGAPELTRQELQDLIVSEAELQGFPPAIALGVARVESDFQSEVVSHKGAIGVMQIMPRTARGEYGVRRADLFDPHVNVRTGIRFLSDLYDEYGRMDIALSHYNGGSAVRTPSGELQIIPATRSYVQRVLQKANLYARSCSTLKGDGHYYVTVSDEVGDVDGWSVSADKTERSCAGLRGSAARRCARLAAPARTRQEVSNGAGWVSLGDLSAADAAGARRTLVRRWESVYAR